MPAATPAGKKPPGSSRMTRLRSATKPTKPTNESSSSLLKSFRSKQSLKENPENQEKLRAYLRIRPPPVESASHYKPYLEAVDDKTVMMRPDSSSSKLPSSYSFDRVFTPSADQDTFFTQTTLPLVSKLLNGENGLMFSYGVSNSGKTYTISGDRTNRGALPRAIDTVFNSIGDLQSDLNLRCVGLDSVEMTTDRTSVEHLRGAAEPKIEDAVRVDRNYSYAVFVSYAEVYNEKVFDLLDAVLPNSSLSSSMSLSTLANSGVLKRRALPLKNDPEGHGKYIAGLHEIRVKTREDALGVFHAGQRARQVFGTLANRESSRSHGIFSIKVVKIHNGAPDDIDGIQVSHLSIVDLAGSERTRNTGTTGDRLKEAGNINKSLMVLGQCLEVLRMNQTKPSRKPAVVPFRHSKLTEIFSNFFVGHGSAVMVVNINPYDTGFDENAHVMKFAANAQEVQTAPRNTLRRQISTQFSAFKHAVSGNHKVKVMVPVETTSNAVEMVEKELEVVEEDGDESEDEGDILVDYLFEQLREVKTLLYESEMRNAALEAEIRDEVAREMQKTFDDMHAQQQRRLQEQVLASERKADRKIDIVSRSISRPAQPRFVRTKLSPTPDTAYLRATPDIDDTTFETNEGETTFESAESHDISVTESNEDPFVVKVDTAQDRSYTENEESLDSVDEVAEMTNASLVIDESDGTEDEDEDDEEDPEQTREEEAMTDEETSDDTLDSADEDESEEDEGSEDPLDDISESESESEFSEFDSQDASFSASPSVSPPRPAPRPSRQTPAKGLKTPARRTTTTAKATPKTSTPLGESKRQVIAPTPSFGPPDSDDEGDHVPELTATMKKKRQGNVQGMIVPSKLMTTILDRRTLGGKVVMEDEMEVGVKTGGAEIRRMGSRMKLTD